MSVRKARHPWSRGGEARGGNVKELGVGSGAEVCTYLSESGRRWY